MTAGESAQAEAQRVREKIENLQRYLYAQERGAEGERITAEALRSLGGAWVVMHDVRWPGRLRANIDHVVVGPTGVYVIDSKNWSGDVRVSNGVLRQNGYNREKNVAGAADGALAIAELLGAAAALVQPVLCFVAQPGMQGFVREVTVCSPDNLIATLLSRPAVLSPQQVFELATRLDAQLRSATEPGRGYRPSDHSVPPAARRPTGPPRSASHQVSVSRTAGPRHPQARRAVHLAVALCAVVFIVVPLMGAIVTAAYTAIAGAGSADSSCTATAEVHPGVVEKAAGTRDGKRRAPATDSTEC